MKRIYKFRGSILLMVLFLIGCAYFGLTLPSDVRVPTHWNIKGEIDGYSSVRTALYSSVIGMVFMFLLFYLMPYYSPKYKQQAVRFEKILPTLCFGLLLFFALIFLHGFALAKWESNLSVNFILVLIGMLFAFLGNILPKAPRNFFVGIRTPWTLSDDDIWQKTHRIGGYAFVLSGVVLIQQGILLTKLVTATIISSILAFAILLYPVLYSFLLYRKKER